MRYPWRRSVMGLLVIVPLLSGNVPEASARTLVLRGGLGPILRGRNPFALGRNRFQRMGRNLALFNGNLFARTPFGLRPIFLDPDSGALQGFVDPFSGGNLLGDLSGIFPRMLPGLGPDARALAEGFLRNQGFDPSAFGGGFGGFGGDRNGGFGNPFLQQGGFDPFGGGDSPGAFVSGRACANDPDGKHGKGACGTEDPAGRRVADTSPLGPDGRLSRSSCKNLVKTVCAGVDPASDEKRVEDMNQTLVREFKINSGTPPGLFDQASSNFVRIPEPFAKVQQSFFDFVKSKAPGFDRAVSAAMSNLLRAVDESPLPESTRAEMRDTFVSLDVRMSPRMEDEASRREFAAQCGPKGLNAGAYSMPATKEFFVCPGLVMRAVALGQDLVKALMHVIPHEVTHQCGADIDPKTGVVSKHRPAWEGVGSCLEAKLRGKFDKFRMLGEVSADIMGIRSMLQEVRGKSPAEALDTVRTGMQLLCYTSNDGIHPGADVRIGLLAESPEMMFALGCPVPRDGCLF